MTSIDINFQKGRGTIKPLHGLNNGPVTYGTLIDVSHYYEQLAIPHVRLHDPNWPHPREVDIPQIFSNWHADPDDPAGYDFDRTDSYIQSILDTGAQIVYRLGVSIEHTEKKYDTHPPQDFTKWAQICIGIIRHYNQGWANGFHHGIKYWEIWNEPNIGDAMWSGTTEQYFELYEVAAPAIKAACPEVMVGGCAVAENGLRSGFVEKYLAHCKTHALPLDFFSWHTYANHPEQIVTNAQHARGLLDSYEFGNTESHLNEWNLVWNLDWNAFWKRGSEYQRRAGMERLKSEIGASFVASTLILLQDAAVDVANYYDGQPSSLFCGLFDYYGVPQKAFYGFKAFQEILAYPERTAAQVSPAGKGLYSLAAIDRETQQAAILISNFEGAEERCQLTIDGLAINNEAVYDIYVLDANHDLALVRTERSTGHASIDVQLSQHCVILIKIQ